MPVSGCWGCSGLPGPRRSRRWRLLDHQATALIRSPSLTFATLTPGGTTGLADAAAPVRWTIPFSGDEHQLLMLTHDQGAGQPPLASVSFDRQDALGTAVLDRVLEMPVRLP